MSVTRGTATNRDARATIVALFDELADGVYTLAVRLLRDTHLAEDVVQETFLAAYRNLSLYRGEGPLAAWIYRIGYRQTIAAHRRRRDHPTEPAVLTRTIPATTPSAEHEAIRNELIERLDAAVDALTPPLRAVFVLRDVEGLSTADTASALGVSESAVKMRLLRARKELRIELKRYL